MFITFGLMYLRRKRRDIRPMVDFGEAPSGGERSSRITQQELLDLVKYMGINGYRLGFDFHFVMGADAPENKAFNCAIAGSSVMQYRKKPSIGIYTDQGTELMKAQYIYRCIEMMKEGTLKTDHLEFVEDIA